MKSPSQTAILKYAMDSIGTIVIPPVFLYAETHFRFFRLFPSFLYRREPEIIFDMPARIAPGKPIPVLLMVNDVDKYPIDILDVALTTTQGRSTRVAFTSSEPSQYALTHPFSKQSLVYLFHIDKETLGNGQIFVNGKVTLRNRGRTSVVLNDNLPTSSHSALSCNLASEELPGSDSCCYGDLHVHSQYSQSHVEFGPPLAVIDEMADSYGLAFVAITDHSYDLACRMDDYLLTDEQAERWKIFVKSANNSTTYKTCLLPGEEVSVRNSRNRTVHLCAVNTREFIPGSRDGARKNARKSSDLSVGEAIAEIRRQGGLSYAAHPGARFGLMQRVFLHRGRWTDSDIAGDLDALQAVNNGFTKSWRRARSLWVRALLAGRRLPLVGGNDAHGDFNRYRCIGTPFLFIREIFGRHLCHVKTGIYCPEATHETVLEAIRLGRTFVTTGPFLGISRSESPPDSIVSICDTSLEEDHVFVLCSSSYEFGMPFRLRVLRGAPGAVREDVAVAEHITAKAHKFVKQVHVPADARPCYLRAELECMRADGARAYAVTSACHLI